MLKRTLDVVVAVTALVVCSPILVIATVAIWLQDYHSPFYIPPRAARGGGTFKMVKLRSMRIGADRSGVDSTSANDTRITGVGQMVRAYKLDELTQLWNVLMGDMSLVGPRPNVTREVALYTAVEQELLSVRPGITDLSSIVFADEGDILKDAADPDLAYNQLIRPWKSRLSLFGIQHSSLRLDLEILWLTALTIVSRSRALAGIERVLMRLGADEQLVRIARRNAPLYAYPPPGAEAVVMSR